MKKAKVEKKLTLEQYQAQTNNDENIKAARSFLYIFTVTIAVVMIVALFFVVSRLFEIHEYAGYAGALGAVIVFIFGYLVPVIKLRNTKSFMTKVDLQTARKAQRYNKKLREEIADKMIDLTYKTSDAKWYTEKNIGALALARHKKDDEQVKETLKTIYATDVKKTSNKLIRQSAVRVGFATALSQSAALDTTLMIVYELNLIKDIVFLYGYRPNEAQMARIYKNVLRNSLIAYGLGGVTSKVGVGLNNAVLNIIDRASQSVSPFTSMIGSVVGGLAGTVFESSVQFAVNATLTVIIGQQTKKYLISEYKLQELLDNVELSDTEEEQLALLEKVKDEIKEKAEKLPKQRKKAA